MVCDKHPFSGFYPCAPCVDEKCERLEKRVAELEAALPPHPDTRPQWGTDDWREWARQTRAALEPKP